MGGGVSQMFKFDDMRVRWVDMGGVLKNICFA